MKNNSFAHGQELPLGLSMALAQVPAAYAYFAKLDPLQRQQIIDSAHCIRSKEEMRDFVKEVLWQEGGKFVGLDHAIPLGDNGITLKKAKGL